MIQLESGEQVDLTADHKRDQIRMRIVSTKGRTTGRATLTPSEAIVVAGELSVAGAALIHGMWRRQQGEQ